MLILAATREEKSELQKRRSESISLIDVRLNRERLIRGEVTHWKSRWVGGSGGGGSGGERSVFALSGETSRFVCTPLIPGL